MDEIKLDGLEDVLVELEHIENTSNEDNEYVKKVQELTKRIKKELQEE